MNIKQTSPSAPEVLKLKATSTFGFFFWFHDSSGTVKKKHHTCTEIQHWGKTRKTCGFGKKGFAKQEHWTGKKWGHDVLNRKNLRVNAVGDIDTSPLFGSLLWKGSTSTTQPCLCFPKQKARHWPIYDFGGSCLRVTAYSYCLSLAPFGASWPCTDCAGYIMLHVGAPWGFHESQDM